MSCSLLEQLKILGIEFRENYNLKSETYVRIDTVARLVVYPQNTKELVEVIKILVDSKVSYRVLGRISNVLFSKQLYEGVIIKTDELNDIFVSENIVDMSCGCFFPSVAKKLSHMDLGGFESLWGIPGSVGGMIRQNAGAFDQQISDRILECTVYDVLTNQTFTLNGADMGFGYRTSIIDSRKYIIISAKFEAECMSKAEIISKAEKYAKLRRQSQPVGKPSLGSVFKKADGIGAGYFIDKLGLKGTACGGAVISDIHAGFILNANSATAEDFLSLIEYIKERVLHKFGVALEEEIEII